MNQPAIRPPLVLVATDVEWVSRSIESVLAARRYAIVRAYTGDQALRRARKLTPDLIILNADLPDAAGADICRRLRDEIGINPSTPILLTTPEPRTRARRREALAAGAWDYLSLPLDVEEFWMRLDTYMRAKRSVDDSWMEGLVDPDTGLYNEKGLLRRATEVGSDAYRHARPLACLIFGPAEEEAETDPASGSHSAQAPAATEALAKLLRSSSRISDVVGRVRASEFVILAPATDGTGAARLAERLLDRFESMKGNGATQTPVQAGVFAVSDFRRAGIDVTTLISRASMALSEARAHGAGEKVHAYGD